MKPLRLSITQAICRVLPPAIAYKPRNWIYPVPAGQDHHERYIIQLVTGSRAECTVDDYAGYLFCTQRYGEWRHWVIAQTVCQNGNTLIEVGSQYGLETLGFGNILKPLNGTVYTFEPFPVNVAKLRKLLTDNQMTNVVVHPVALGETGETLHFALPPETHTGLGHVFSEADTPAAETDLIEVSAIPLDSLQQTLAHVRLICIDVEGYEIPVLRGATVVISQHRPLIIVEADQRIQERAGFGLQQLQAELQGMGYTVYRITRFGLDLADPENPAKRNWNWLAIHQSEPDSTRQRVIQAIRRCGWLPPIAGINPLVKS